MNSDFFILNNSCYQKKKIEFSFLGDRDYIDSSTINIKLFSELDEIEFYKITNYKVKIHTAITSQCDFFIYKNPIDKLILKRNNCNLEVQFIFKNIQYFGYLFSTENKLSKRTLELNYNLSESMLICNNEIHLLNPLNDDLIFNFMKMGKYLINHLSHFTSPKVARFEFKYLFKVNLDYKLSARIQFLSNNYILLQCLNNHVVFGNSLIKGY